ncbi:unnamed protein product, partial [Scytosiphon promiscuus]
MKSATMVDGDTAVVVVGNLEYEGGYTDFVAVKLDASDGTEIWRYEDTTNSSRYLNGVVEADGGSVVLAGSMEGTDGTRSEDGTDYADFAAIKLDADGLELWTFKDGTLYADWFGAVEVQQDGSLLFVGATNGSWSGVNSEGSSGLTTDVVVMSLSTDGEELWRWQAGSGDEDSFTTIAVGADGRVLVAGCTAGSWGQPNSGDEDFIALLLDTGFAPTPAPSTTAPTTPPSKAPTPPVPSPVPPSASPAGPTA